MLNLISNYKFVVFDLTKEKKDYLFQLCCLVGEHVELNLDRIKRRDPQGTGRTESSHMIVNYFFLAILPLAHLSSPPWGSHAINVQPEWQNNSQLRDWVA